MALGDAFIDVHANTAPFKKELAAAVRPALGAAEKRLAEDQVKNAKAATQGIENQAAATRKLIADTERLRAERDKAAIAFDKAQLAMEKRITSHDQGRVDDASLQRAFDIKDAAERRLLGVTAELTAAERALAAAEAGVAAAATKATAAINEQSAATGNNAKASARSVIQKHADGRAQIATISQVRKAEEQAYKEQAKRAQAAAKSAPVLGPSKEAFQAAQKRIKEIADAEAAAYKESAQRARAAAKRAPVLGPSKAGFLEAKKRIKELAEAEAAAYKEQAKRAQDAAKRGPILGPSKAEFLAAKKAIADIEKAHGAAIEADKRFNAQRVANATKASDAIKKAAAEEARAVEKAAKARIAAEREAGKAGTASLISQRKLAEQIRGASRGAGGRLDQPKFTFDDKVQRVRVIITENGSKGVIASLKAIQTEAQKIGKYTGFGQLISVGAGAATTALNAMAQATKFATVGAIALGGALAFVGLESADNIQAAKIGFEGLAAEIADTTPNIDQLTRSLEDIPLDESADIAKGFVEQLQAIARESAISQSTLFSTSQQLLSLGYNGEQTRNIILSLGGALASSGKSGGELNENLRGVVTAFSQIQGAGRLLAQDLNQITTRIPALTRGKFLKQYIADTKHAGDATKVTAKELASLQAEFRKGNANISSDAAIKSLLKVGQELDRTAARAADLRKKLADNFAQIRAEGVLTAQDLNGILAEAKVKDPSKVYLELAKSIGLVSDKTKSLSADQKKQVQDAISNGKIAADAAVKAIEEGVGANASALKRINEETFGGAFEALKDTIRQQLGQAFAAPEVAGPILDVIKNLGEQIGPIIDSLAPKLAKFSAELFGAIGKSLPAIATAVGQVFDVLGTALGAIGPQLPAIIAGFGQLFEIINQVATSDAAAELFNSLGDAIPQIVDALTAAGPAFAFVADSAASLVEIVLELTPLLVGVGDVLGALGTILSPIALLLRQIKELFDFIPPGVLETIGAIVAALGTFTAIAVGLPALLALIGAAIGAVTIQVTALTIALLANPFVLAGIAVAALVVGLVILAKKFEVVRVALTTGLELIARYFTTQIDLMLLAIEGLFRAFDKVGGFLGKVIPGLGGLADKAGDAANSIADLRHTMDDAVGSISELGAKSDGAAGSVRASASAVEAFNKAAQGTGQKALEAGASVDQLNDAIAKLPLEKRISILVDIGVSNTNFLKSKNIPLTGLEDATGFSTDGINAAAKEAQDSALKITDGFVNSLPGGSGGSGGSGAGGKDAKKAKEQIDGFFKSFRDSIKKASDKVDVREAMQKLRQALKEALDLKDLPDKLTAKLQKQNKKLQRLVEQRASIAERLKKANEAFDSTFQSASGLGDIVDVFDSISDAANNAADAVDLSRLRIIKPGQDTVAGAIGGLATTVKSDTDRLQDALNTRLQTLRDFNEDIKTLIERGASRSIVKQLIEGGAEKSGALADQLAKSSDSSLKAISEAQKAIDDQAKILAGFAADEAASIGENVSLGIVEGLKKRRGEIAKEIETLVSNIIKTLRKQLGIKSPSTVVADKVGQYIVPGITEQIAKDGHLVDKAVNGIGSKLSKANLSLRPISTPELGKLARAEATVQLKRLADPTGTQASFDQGAKAIVGAIQGGYARKPGVVEVRPTPPPARFVGSSGFAAVRSSQVNTRAGRR